MFGELAFGQRGDEPGGWLAARSLSIWLPVVFTADSAPKLAEKSLPEYLSFREF
jgi:hypothetical protein